jgi:hypothetical protein
MRSQLRLQAFVPASPLPHVTKSEQVHQAQRLVPFMTDVEPSPRQMWSEIRFPPVATTRPRHRDAQHKHPSPKTIFRTILVESRG